MMLDRLFFLATTPPSGESVGPISNEQMEKWVEFAIPYLIKVAGVLVLLFFVLIIANWVSRRVVKTLGKTNFDLTLSKFFGKMAKWLILLMGVLAALGIFGISTSSFAAVLAAAGLAIGLAFQGTLSNFASGIMLLVFRPFGVGDVINAAGVVGKVDEIGIFTTIMDTPDNRRIIVPNGAIFGSTIENISHHKTRRVDVGVGTDYSADLDKTREVLMKAAAAVEPRLSSEEPVVVLSELGGSSIDWSVRVWVNAGDYWAVKDRLTRDIKIALDGAGIGIPFPQLDVHMDGQMAGA